MYPLRQLIPTILDQRVSRWLTKRSIMDEFLIELYELTGLPMPIDLQVKAVEQYGYILEQNNNPQEDTLDGE